MEKRVTLFSGHYGSGKTNIAVSYAVDLRTKYENVMIADLDIVNPYFRTKDSSELLQNAGIRLVCSEYANTNLDIPALPQDLYALTDDLSYHAVIDVGGDDRGALALGRIAPALRRSGDYEMLMVINCYRPLTRSAEDVMEVLREIEAASGLPFTGLVNNSNLGEETTASDLLRSVPFAKAVSESSGLPIVMTTVKQSLYPDLVGQIPDLFPLELQKKIC